MTKVHNMTLYFERSLSTLLPSGQTAAPAAPAAPVDAAPPAGLARARAPLAPARPSSSPHPSGFYLQSDKNKNCQDRKYYLCFMDLKLDENHARKCFFVLQNIITVKVQTHTHRHIYAYRTYVHILLHIYRYIHT